MFGNVNRPPTRLQNTRTSHLKRHAHGLGYDGCGMVERISLPGTELHGVCIKLVAKILPNEDSECVPTVRGVRGVGILIPVMIVRVWRYLGSQGPKHRWRMPYLR